MYWTPRSAGPLPAWWCTWNMPAHPANGKLLGTCETDADGRCANLLPQNGDPVLQPGQYRLRFETGTYHAAQMVKGLYLTVEIIVTVRPAIPTCTFHYS